MRRFVGLVVVILLATSAGFAADLREQVRRAASLIYVHGITQELAEEQIGRAGVPYLLELLEDPEFERRDNIVAFLGYLALDADTPKLMKLLEKPPVVNDRPEEHRARLLVPEALGRIGAEVDGLARQALAHLKAEVAADDRSGFSQMIDYGMAISANAIDLTPVEEEGTNYDRAIDPVLNSHALYLDYANHVDVFNPISDQQLDAALEAASLVMGTDDFSGDTACCVELRRTGTGQTWGSPGDGLDVIGSSGELSTAFNASGGRVKVVDLINWCGGSGSNIIGCASRPGYGMAVVRISPTQSEGLLWAHELGHNAGLSHNPTPGLFIMSSGLGNNNLRLTESECYRYHTPLSPSGLIPQQIGYCDDDDGDYVVSTVDNCPDESNNNQLNSDSDEFGNACDNCTSIPNPDQANCDNDSLGDACDPESLPPGSPIEPISFSSKTKLTWPLPFRTTSKNIYRGSWLSGDSFTFNQTLLDSLVGISSNYTDLQTPDSQQVFFYLVRAFNACGEGP